MYNSLQSRVFYFCCAAWLVLSLAAGCTKPPVEATPTPAPVVAIPIHQETISAEIRAVGTVVAVERSRVAAGAEGLVVRFPLDVGEVVEEGDVLAELRSVTLSIELNQAQAVLRQREQQYAQLKQGYRSEEIGQAEARLRGAEAASQFAEANERRMHDLRDRAFGAVTDQDFEQAVLLAEQARQTLAEARANYDMVSAGYRQEEVEAARASAEAQQHEVSRLRDELAKREIRAPFKGFVVEKHTDVGEWVALGGMVATLVKLDEVEVQVNVEESRIHEIDLDQEVQIHIDALGRQPVRGRVRFVVPRSQWEMGSRSFPVIVRMQNVFDQGRPRLHEGMVARVLFQGLPRQAMLAPKDAIVRNMNGALVYVVGEDRKVRAVEVVEGLSQGHLVEVQGSLQPGQLVVTEGAERVHPFDQVALVNTPETEQQAGAGGAAGAGWAGGGGI